MAKSGLPHEELRIYQAESASKHGASQRRNGSSLTRCGLILLFAGAGTVLGNLNGSFC
jgi:hypothetical protein